LLAFRRHAVEEWRPEAVNGLIPVDHDAVGFLEAGGQRGA
jgi:hypothetical protein